MSLPALTGSAFAALVRDAPLVSLDLIVRNANNEILLGFRRNKPAQDMWFVPGGRVRKNETLDFAFARLTTEELGFALPRNKAEFLGVYEHFYTDSAVGDDISTHYVVLAYSINWNGELSILPKAQHSQYCWAKPERMAQDVTVHANSRAYIRVAE